MAVPADAPVTTPVPPTTVATVVPPLVQVPPVVPSVNVIVEPTQNDEDAGILDGAALTVIIVVTVQPVPNEYVISDVPDNTPVTTPVPAIVATVVVPLVHVPPVVPSVKVIVEPAQNEDEAGIADGSPFTVTVVVV